MNIGIIGATGNIGRCLLAEAISRGHHVTAFTRDKTYTPKTDTLDRVVWKEVNVLDADGQSRISYEDCAVAIIDEAELPRHVQRRFTIGY